MLGIKINDEGRASFAFRLDDLRPKGLKGDTLFYESFDSCDGKGGNDGRWGGYIGAGKFKPDHEGWRFAVPEATSAGSRCALIGTSTKYGIVESTPLFYVEDGSTITFKAAAWNNEEGSLTVASLNPKVQLSETRLKLPNRSWQTFTLTVKGSGLLRLSMRNGQRRFFLDELLVKRPATTSITDIPTARPAPRATSGRIYSLDGVYLGTNINALSKGVYIVDGKKVVK